MLGNGLAGAAQGRFFRATNVTDGQLYSEGIHGYGTRYRAHIIGYLDRLPWMDPAEARQDQEELFDAGTELLLAVAEQGVLGNDRSLLRQLQTTVANYRDIVLRDLPRLPPGLATEGHPSIEPLRRRLWQIDSVWTEQCRSFAAFHAANAPNYSVDLTDFLARLTLVSAAEIAKLGGNLPACVITDHIRWPHIEQFYDASDRLIQGQWAHTEAEASIMRLARNPDAPTFVALAATGPVNFHGESRDALIIHCFEREVPEGNTVIVLYRPGPGTIEVQSHPVFVARIPTAFPVPGEDWP